MLISTVAVHEMGHAVAGILSGCEHVEAVLYSSSHHPRTELWCSSISSETAITLAGIGAPLIVSLLFLGLAKLRFMGVMMIGFGLFVSVKDLADAQIGWITPLVLVLSVCSLLYASNLFTHYYLTVLHESKLR